MTDLTTELLVQSALAIANANMVRMVLVRRGDSAHGSVLVRLDQPDGGAILESRVLSATGYEWISLHGDTVLSADEASARLDSEIAFDPDCWVVAIDSVMGDNPLKELV